MKVHVSEQSSIRTRTQDVRKVARTEAQQSIPRLRGNGQHIGLSSKIKRAYSLMSPEPEASGRMLLTELPFIAEECITHRKRAQGIKDTTVRRTADTLMLV